MNTPTMMAKGQDVRVGDDLWYGGKPFRITRIEPYTHPCFPDEQWFTAYSDGPETGGKNAWAITLEHEEGYAAMYEVTRRPESPGEGLDGEG